MIRHTGQFMVTGMLESVSRHSLQGYRSVTLFFKDENFRTQLIHGARVNQQPRMHQLAILSTGWAVLFHSTSDEVHHSPFLSLLIGVFFFFLGLFLVIFSLDLTSHIATLLTFILSKILYQSCYLTNYSLLT